LAGSVWGVLSRPRSWKSRAWPSIILQTSWISIRALEREYPNLRARMLLECAMVRMGVRNRWDCKAKRMMRRWCGKRARQTASLPKTRGLSCSTVPQFHCHYARCGLEHVKYEACTVYKGGQVSIPRKRKRKRAADTTQFAIWEIGHLGISSRIISHHQLPFHDRQICSYSRHCRHCS
jgi:hypothetical protein